MQNDLHQQKIENFRLLAEGLKLGLDELLQSLIEAHGGRVALGDGLVAEAVGDSWRVVEEGQGLSRR